MCVTLFLIDFWRLYQSSTWSVLLVKHGYKYIYIIVILMMFATRKPYTYLYTTQRVAEGIMFLTRPSSSQSVCQSVSPIFLVSATPLKPLNRISWNFVVMTDILCRRAYPQAILIPFFFSQLRPFWT